MKNIMEYKGYYTKVEYSVEDKLLFGQIEDIADLITFNAKGADDIEDAFKVAVDDYLELCAEIEKNPEKPYKGSFNIRISPELHKKAAKKAFTQGISLNEFVAKSIENALVEKTDFIESQALFKIYQDINITKEIKYEKEPSSKIKEKVISLFPPKVGGINYARL